MSDLSLLAQDLAQAARAAAPALARAGSALKDAALAAAARGLHARSDALLQANAADLAAGAAAGLSAAMLDRLRLDRGGLEKMALQLAQVAALPDPIGQVLDGSTRPNGLQLLRRRCPLGVVLMVYESRPNVTVDAAALCLKSGNAAILRGGKEALRTNLALAEVLTAALSEVGLPPQAIQVVATPERALLPELLARSAEIDLVVPRGGRGLIEAVMAHSRIPVLKHLDGICHVFVDESAELEAAWRIVGNAKCQRPGVCNALETLLVHEAVAPTFLPTCLAQLHAAGVELRGDDACQRLAAGVPVQAASEQDWGTEYLDLILSVRVVPDLATAVAHINRYGSRHTDAILTRDLQAAEQFVREVDSSSVMVNASTRFSDGFEYGLGAELGISTDKLHARGPVGLEGLTTYKWIVLGDGQVRT